MFCLTVSTCLSTVPSAKNSGFLVSTTTRSKKQRQDFFGLPDQNEKSCKIHTIQLNGHFLSIYQTKPQNCLTLMLLSSRYFMIALMEKTKRVVGIINFLKASTLLPYFLPLCLRPLFTSTARGTESLCEAGFYSKFLEFDMYIDSKILNEASFFTNLVPFYFLLLH